MRLEAYYGKEGAAVMLRFMMRCFRFPWVAVFGLFSFGTLLAVYVPPDGSEGFEGDGGSESGGGA